MYLQPHIDSIKTILDDLGLLEVEKEDEAQLNKYCNLINRFGKLTDDVEELLTSIRQTSEKRQSIEVCPQSILYFENLIL